ncbi:MAG: metalloregulator ArsR/SmtB family transcription factor [Anaerolineaceae bacterium]|nr:metalloregulator ArsR/SmtB family transcription factor [Anaerolineaceae bacterium]
MDEQARTEELLNFFKALSDINRLKIVSLLAQNELTVEQMAEMLNLRSSTISHHLSKLVKVGLVSARSESYYNIYRLENKTLEEMSQRVLAKDTLPAVAADIDIDAYDRKVLNNYITADGKIKTIPVQQKKLFAILHFIVDDFEIGKQYSEKEVNEILERRHEDFASLRRELFEIHLLGRDRDGGKYWRIPD